MLLAERPPEALTVDAVVEAAGVAKGTFYTHFQSISELAAAVGVMLGESFDAVLTPARLEMPDPVDRVAFAFTQFLQKGISDRAWARLVVQSSQIPKEFGRGIREHLRSDLAEAIANGQLAVVDADLAAEIVMGIWLQVTRGILERGVRSDLPRDALDAALRAIGATPLEVTQDITPPTAGPAVTALTDTAKRHSHQG